MFNGSLKLSPSIRRAIPRISKNIFNSFKFVLKATESSQFQMKNNWILPIWKNDIRAKIYGEKTMEEVLKKTIKYQCYFFKN